MLQVYVQLSCMEPRSPVAVSNKLTTSRITRRAIVLIFWRKSLSKTSSYSSGYGRGWPLCGNVNRRGTSDVSLVCEDSLCLRAIVLASYSCFIAHSWKLMFHLTTRRCSHAWDKDLFINAGYFSITYTPGKWTTSARKTHKRHLCLLNICAKSAFSRTPQVYQMLILHFGSHTCTFGHSLLHVC